jgi:hypothetical protein
MPPVPRVNSPGGRNYPATPMPHVVPGPMNHSVPAARFAGKSALDHSDARTRVATFNERWTLGLGAASAGTFTLTPTIAGSTFPATGPINFNATVANVQAAFDALLGAGNVLVAGSALPTGPMTIDFTGQFAGDSVALVGAFGGLTGATPSLVNTTDAVNVSGGIAADEWPGGRVGPRTSPR